MLLIKTYDPNMNFRVIKHGKDIFREAIRGVRKGEEFFHVKKNGENLFDLQYVDNQKWAMRSPDFPKGQLFNNYCLCPPMLDYDADASELICLDVFSGKKTVWFEDANEYSVTLTDILLRDTDINIIFKDERILEFFNVSDRLSVTEEIPDEKDLLKVQQQFYPSIIKNDYDTLDIVSCFYSVMIIQWILDKPIEEVKYFEFVESLDEGIGSVLNEYAGFKNLLSRFGKPVTIAPGGTRYDDSLLTDYFNVVITPSDSTSDNTVTIANAYAPLFTKMIGGTEYCNYTIDEINPVFRDQLEFYYREVIGDRKMLGLFLRGSDYYVTKLEGPSKPVTMEDGIPIIRQFFEKGDYDGILLATEDRDILKAVRDAFPGKVVAVAQERYSVSDFVEVNTISALEKSRRTQEEYNEYINDTTVNYFYAIYLVSRCKCVLYSNHCLGSFLMKSFGRGMIKEIYCLAEQVYGSEGQDN